MVTQSLLTVDEFLKSPESLDEKRRFDLRYGEIVEMVEPSAWHNYVREVLARHMGNFVETGQLGMVLSETGFYINSNSWYRADIVFWDSEHWAAVLDDFHAKPITIIPQLVVEVISPSEREPLAKADDYVRAGVHTVWVIFERPYEIHIFEPAGVRRIVRAGEKLEAPALLPGFSEDPARLLPARS